MTKYFLLFLIAAQSLCFSENIKFYIFDSRHGNELKPDSVILENVTTKKRIYLLTDTLILTEVGTSAQAFINTSPDFKAKANIINNNIDLEIDNTGAENLSIELYGYIGNSVFSEDTPINIGVSRKNISLENINDKLLFLRIKSAKSIQTIKLNRTISDFAYEATPILKSGDEILNGDIIDTAYKYNLYIYKKGYRDYKDKYISFTGKKYYVANLVEKTPAEKITKSSFKMHGFTVITSYNSSSFSAPTPTHDYQRYDTTNYELLINISQNAPVHEFSFARCRPFTNDLGSEYIEVCEGGGDEHLSNKNIITTKWLLNSRKLENPILNRCWEMDGGLAQYYKNSNLDFKLTGQYTYENIGGKYYLLFDKAGIQKIIDEKALYFYFYSKEYHENSASSSYGNSTNLVRILSISDDAYIEISFWE